MKITEEAKSKAQQRLFGMAYAVKTGDLDLDNIDDDEIREKIQNLVDSLSQEKLREYAATKHNDLPDRVTNEMVKNLSEENYATLQSVSGMGEIRLPIHGPGATSSQIGSGDVPGTFKTIFTEVPAKTISLSDFKNLYHKKNDEENEE